MIIETAKSNTSICVILITLIICWGCGRVTQYFPTSFPIHRGVLRAGQARIQRREQAQCLESWGWSRLAGLPVSSATRAPERQLFEEFGPPPEERFAIGFVLGKWLTKQIQTHTHKILQVANKCSGKRAAGKLLHTWPYWEARSPLVICPPGTALTEEKKRSCCIWPGHPRSFKSFHLIPPVFLVRETGRQTSWNPVVGLSSHPTPPPANLSHT